MQPVPPQDDVRHAVSPEPGRQRCLFVTTCGALIGHTHRHHRAPANWVAARVAIAVLAVDTVGRIHDGVPAGLPAGARWTRTSDALTDNAIWRLTP